MLNNIMYLNEKPFDFGLSTPSYCSHCNFFSENITHLFCDCAKTQCFSKKLYLKLKDDLTLPPLTPQVDIFGFLESDCQSYLIQNKFLSSTLVLKDINKIENREKVTSVNQKKNIAYKRKCGKIKDKLPERADNTVI